VAEATRGIVLHPELNNASEPTLPTIWKAFTAAVTTVGHLPKTLIVKEPSQAAMFRPVAERLGFAVQVKPRLRVVEGLRFSLLMEMGETPFGLPDFLEEEL
jgi:hypothetical protein